MSFPETIPDLLEWRAARASAGAAWLRFEGDTWTLPDVVAEVDCRAVGLAQRGVVRGDFVALLLGSPTETLFTWLAVSRLGAAAAILPDAATGRTLESALARLGPRVLVVGEQARASATAAALRTLSETTLATPFELTRSGGGAPRAEVSPDDLAVLLYTSGTTDAAKVVMHTHRTYALAAEAFPWWLGLTADDRLLCPISLSRLGAQAYSAMGALGCGAGLILLGRFHASRFWEDARRHGATEASLTGAMLETLASEEPRPSDRENPLRLCHATLALPESQHRAFEERFGLRLTVSYHLTETPFGTVWPRATSPYGTLGALAEHPRLGALTRARIVRESGAEAASGEVGELWLASPATMRGYLLDAVATEGAFEGKWLRTGDLVCRDGAGVLTFVGRTRDVIHRGGEAIRASEIEAALLRHGGVQEAAVLGVKGGLGEAAELVAFVVPKPGGHLDPEQLRAFVREELPSHKVPSRVHARSSLPRAKTGHVAKHLLSETHT